MRKTYLLAAVAAMTLAGSANAANLINAKVTGPTGTIWDTTQNNFYTLFLQFPGLGNFLNPNDEAINFVPGSNNNILTAGEGFRDGDTQNSDVIYTLTLGFADGATLVGSYDTITNSFLGGNTTTVGGTTYSLNEFSWERSLQNSVNQFRAVPGGNGNDYSGNFAFTTSMAGAVPEPATWAMMIGGFGLVGGAMRRRSTKVAFA